MLSGERAAKEKEMETVVSNPRDPASIHCCLHIFILMCVYFFQMCPDVAGDVQSTTGERLRAR